MTDITAPAPIVESRDRLQIGQATVHRLADMQGIAWPATAVFRDLPEAALAEAARLYPDAIDATKKALTLSFNSYIVETPDLLCLIDCGIGNGKKRPDRPLWHRRNGDFMQRLSALNYAAEDFDIVINTHLHADHVGWNTMADAGRWKPTFPNARYVIPKPELAHWENLYRQDSHVLHGAFADSVQPILDADLYDSVDLLTEVEPGLWLEAAPGHTLGMAVVRLCTTDGDLLFLADVVHSPIQLATPDLTSNFCVDPAQARATRHRLLDACARSHTIVATYHFPPPAFGHIMRSELGYKFEPLARA